MIYLFYGSDTERVRRKAFAFVDAARKKQPELAYRRLAREELSASALDDIASTGGLFISRMLVLLDDPFPPTRKGAEEEADAVENQSTEPTTLGSDAFGSGETLTALAASDNAIVILAPKLSAAKAKSLTAKAAKSYEFNTTERSFSRGFNSALVNALAAHDSKRLWLEIQRALRAGDAPEAVHGLLHWEVRELMQTKAKAREARALSRSLIGLLMECRRTGADLAAALERWSLSV